MSRTFQESIWLPEDMLAKFERAADSANRAVARLQEKGVTLLLPGEGEGRSGIADVATLIAPDAKKRRDAMPRALRISGGGYKYCNTRVYFYVPDAAPREEPHSSESGPSSTTADKPVAVSLIGFPDPEFAGREIPFGIPPAIVATKYLGMESFGGVMLKGTSFEGPKHGPCNSRVPVFRIDLLLLDERHRSSADKSLLQRISNVSTRSEGEAAHMNTPVPRPIVPLVRPKQGSSPLCNSTDLVIFLMCTRPPRSGSMAELGPEILMLVEKNNSWFVPAGHVERNQSFADAAAMELMEETGYTLDKRAPLEAYDVVYGSQSYCPYNPVCAPIHILYHGAVDETVPQVEAVDGNGTMWVPLLTALEALNGGNDDPDAALLQSTFAGMPFRKPYELWEVLGKFADALKLPRPQPRPQQKA